jgi:hypothetical protein
MDQLIKDIKANRCILFLGPLTKTYKGVDNNFVSNTELYCGLLADELTRSMIAFDANARYNPYYLASKFLDGSPEKFKMEEDIMTKAYGNPNADIHAELAVIPFNTIVNFGFDHLMIKALDKAGFEYEYKYYNYQGDEEQSLDIDKDIPLVYNLFGSIDDQSSVIKNERQQLEFMHRINSSPKLPDDLFGRIQDDGRGPKSYVFLGFDFNDWPFRFLLDTLKIPKVPHSSVSPKRHDENIAVMAHDFYTERFGINFVDQSPEDFVNQLVETYRSTVSKHEFGYISYDKSDESFLEEFKLYLLNNKIVLTRKINFFDRTMIDDDQLTAKVVAENLGKSTIHIMLINQKAINDPDFRQEVDESVKGDDVLIFPIIISLCSWRTVFPMLEERASIVLPGKNAVLNSSQKKVSDEDFVKILEIINTKIR